MNIAAFLGCLSFAGPFAFAAPRLFFLIMLCGLPIAFAFCWIVAAPVLYCVMRKPLSWLRAVVWGALISALIGGVYGLLLSPRRLIVPQSSGGDAGDLYNWHYSTATWLDILQYCLPFMFLGAVVALIVRAIIGPGKRGAHG
ncbi:MAG: hypothetical protein AB3N22_03925 [Ruegeria sp.]